MKPRYQKCEFTSLKKDFKIELLLEFLQKAIKIIP